jgi:hypothetical protein
MVDTCLLLGPAKINPLSAQLAGLNPNTCVDDLRIANANRPIGRGSLQE